MMRLSVFVLFIALLQGLFFSGCTDKLSPVDTDTFDESDVIGILISPEKLILPLGQSVQLQATGLLDNRTSRDLTHYVTWMTSASKVATVSNGLDQEGLTTGVSVGSAKIRAQLAGVYSVEVDVEVTEATLVGLAIEPREITVEEGQTVQLKATAVFSDGQRSNAAAQVRWVTKDGSVATLTAEGLLTGKAKGETEVYVQWGAVSSEASPVSVKRQAPPDIAVSQVVGESSDTLLSLTVEVSNFGDVGASDFFVDVFLDKPSEPEFGDFGDDWFLVLYLGPGESMRHTFTFELSRGEHSVQVLADSLNHVEEPNEDNNLFGTTVNVGTGDSGPNLTFDRFEYIADYESVYYAIDVVNSGSETVGSFFVDLFLDSFSAPVLHSDGDEFVDVLGLEPGETQYADFFLEEPCQYCYSWILVDSYDEIDETDETDNIAGALYIVAGS